MSAVDRSAPPPAGPTPRIALPRVERTRAHSGMRVAATSSDATPELLLELALPSGRVREPLGREGLASLTALMLQEGTRAHSTVEFIDALDFLGAHLAVRSDDDETTLELRVLERHAERALQLVGDLLLEPRFAEHEFERVRQQRRASLRSRSDDPKSVVYDVWSRLYWGRSTALGSPGIGDEESLLATSLDDVRRFHAAALAQPRVWRCAGVCRGGLEQLLGWLAPLEARLAKPAANAEPPLRETWSEPTPLERKRSRLYVCDRPGAPQSELRVGHPSVASSHPDWLALSALNLALGGVFSSRLNLNLRENKGYTYGIRSSFDGGRRPGAFSVATSVDTRNSAPALREIVRELEGFTAGATLEELAFVRSSLEQSLARQFESPQARLSFVSTIERLGLRDDYPLQRLAWLAGATPAASSTLLGEHLRPSELLVVVVGDLTAVGRELADLGLGSPVKVDSRGDERRG